MSELAKFEAWLARKGRQATTIARYRTGMRRLMRELRVIDRQSVEDFIFSLKKQGLRHNTINNYVDCARLWGQFTGDGELQKTEYYPDQAVMKATMSDSEIEAFLGVPRRFHQPTKHFKRMNVFWSTMAYSGMRCGEAAKLKATEDVDFGRGVFVLRDTKTHDPRYVPIAPNLIPMLESYLKEIDTEYLFQTTQATDKRMDAPVIDNTDWGYDFHKRLEQIGIKRQNLTPYSFRFSFITRMLEEDINIFKVQKIVGHRQIATTAHYTRLTTKDIIKTIKMDRLGRGKLEPKEKLQQIVEAVRAYGVESDDDFFYEFCDKRLVVAIK